MIEIKDLKLKITDYRGFTIVELLVTTFVFSIMALVATAILVRAMEIERKSFSAQVIQENALAVLELMAKEIRVGTVAGPDSACLNNSLSLIMPDSVSVVYGLSGGIVTRQYGSDTYFISSNDVTFSNLKFCILNSGLDNQPTRVTILASISNTIGQISTVNLQTTITSRDIVSELGN